MNDVYVSTHNLGKRFGAKAVLTDVEVSVQPGDVVGVLGKNGAGKTTLLESILGFTRATKGEARAFGYDSFALPVDAKVRIGFVPQRDELLDTLTARDQLRVVSSFYKNWDTGMIERLCSVWELNLNERVRGMSVGQRQKLSILLALGHRPDLLVLDEPVASLDPIARRRFLEQIVDIAADSKRSVIFSSHIVSDVERLANKIWILKDGRIYWQGEVDALKESVVRIHIRGARSLPEGFRVPGALSTEIGSNFVTAVTREWSEATRAELERTSGVQVDVEALSLEDIFLELHR